VRANTRYGLAVGDAFDSAEQATLRFRFFPSPANDRWEQRQSLPTDSSTFSGNSASATLDVLESIHGFGPVVKYEWTAPQSGRARVRYESLDQEAKLSAAFLRRAAQSPPGIPAYPDVWGVSVTSGDRLWILVPPEAGAFSLAMRLDTAELRIDPTPVVEAGRTAQARVEVTSFDGPIREVEFRVDGTLLGADPTAPFT